jgi:signal transduction histidine kinase
MGTYPIFRYVMAGLLLACAVPVAWAQASVQFTRAEFVLSDQAKPPGDAAAWKTVSLPHVWDRTDPGKTGLGWYRIRFRLEKAPGGAQAIHIPHVRSVWVDFYVNGALAGGSRDIVSGGNTGIGTGVYLTVIPGALHEGENVLHARMRIMDPIQGLGRVDFGDARPVRRVALMHTELNFYAQRAFLAMVLAAGLITLFVWRARPEDAVMMWFCIACLSWALVGVAFNALRWVDVPAWFIRLLARYQVWGLAVPAVIIALRSVGLRWPRAEALFWAFLAVEVTAPFWLGDGFHALYFDIGSAALLTAGAALILVAAPRPLGRPYAIEAAALLLMALLMCYEALRYLGWVDVDSATFRSYHVPVMVLAIGAAIFERHVVAVRGAESANADLRQRVEEKTREIEAYHAERAAALREQALALERRRIIADMHDGLGASLLALLRYAQGGRVEGRELEQRVKETLQELRIAIDALEPAEGDLASVLGSLRFRLEPLVAPTGVRLRWDVAPLPPVEALEPSAVFAIQRILLQAISNAVQHSGAREIHLAARAKDGDGIEVSVADDGVGFDTTLASAGRGIANMRARAAQLQASLSITSRPGRGSVVSLALPHSLCPGLPAADARAGAPASRASPGLPEDLEDPEQQPAPG